MWNGPSSFFIQPCIVFLLRSIVCLKIVTNKDLPFIKSDATHTIFFLHWSINEISTQRLVSFECSKNQFLEQRESMRNAKHFSIETKIIYFLMCLSAPLSIIVYKFVKCTFDHIHHAPTTKILQFQDFIFNLLNDCCFPAIRNGKN